MIHYCWGFLIQQTSFFVEFGINSCGRDLKNWVFTFIYLILLGKAMTQHLWGWSASRWLNSATWQVEYTGPFDDNTDDNNISLYSAPLPFDALYLFLQQIPFNCSLHTVSYFSSSILTVFWSSTDFTSITTSPLIYWITCSPTRSPQF